MGWFADAHPWHSGEWFLELRDGEIADVSFAGHRVLRSILAVIRDQNWDTVNLIVNSVSETPTGLTLDVRSRHPHADIRGTMGVAVEGTKLSVTLDLTSQKEFWTNRTGLVVLCPAQAAGVPLEVTHPGGSTEQTTFPRAISPHQPVLDISALRWQDDGLDIEVRFTGDVFEMEDQRNWTDASYKTYNRPLSLPFPYRLAQSERILQTVEVSVHEVAAPRGNPSETIVLAPAGRFPEIAVGAATAAGPKPPLPEPLGSTVLIELDLATPNWRAALSRIASSGRPLDVRFVLADGRPEAIADGARALAGLRVVRAAAFWPTGPARHVSDGDATQALRQALTSHGVHTSVVGGSRAHFTELNREHHRLPSDLDGIVFSVTPLFHSLTTEQLIESLAMQRIVACQAVEIAAGSPLHIGPVTLRPHFNDVALTPPPMSTRDDLADGYGPQLIDANDPRYDAPELAAWTIASAAAMAVPGVATLAYFEEWGPRGIRDSSGAERPVAAAIRALTSLSGSVLLSGESSDGRIWATGKADDVGAVTVLAANLDTVDRMITVLTPGGTIAATLAPCTWRYIP